ncbi:hypothetical protein AGABI2DRAFT_64785 [Agaricus bisporus var. bisporus H97]|uniref:hypothetical protein n=1 Tax=Agaricus bisporus var. bisporus (strain H97 / ATCC MYA-4626 / FGSC 10389) TaxID=936046 RepID=UPI00029F57E4|nr:hypothetical protein AGABI2DRAFT_64785 [Agaricus bisporus var. bisporus H97]EKV49867.1 hypothetical protein AGABI2DRAFT_64785 [Agaricus bisporus var. bisporus H97]
MHIGSCFVKLLAFVLAAAISKVAADDLSIYTDNNVNNGWENWSWSSTIDFAATDLIAGSSGSSISVTSEQFAALSLHYNAAPIKGFEGLQFDIAGDQPDISISIESVADGVISPSMALSSISKSITSDSFTTVLINFNDLPGNGGTLADQNWDRISFQAGNNGATYHVDNMLFVESIVIAPEFLSAEPLGSNVVAVTTKGDVDFSTVRVKLNGNTVRITGKTSYSPVDTPAQSITYLTLASSLRPGKLVITADGGKSFDYTLSNALSGSINKSIKSPINPHIYGVNFPVSADYIQHLGITISRWGGNAVTAYNPFDGFTNAGADWYFENRGSTDGTAEDWLAWVQGAGSDALLTVPALDWVSKDSTSYSYPVSIYGDQADTDPFNSDAGNGLFPNGTAVAPPDPTTVYTGWNTSLAQTWLKGLANKPLMVAIDNEIEIASSTHRDMHPDPMSYDEELDRVVRFATTAKEAIPDILVVAPSTCCWWFYWTTTVGWDDTTAHNNTDFLPWFLGQMKAVEATTGKRLLDYLDIHYYFAADTSANDDAAKAKRLRMTRSWWDESYVDESWVGQDPIQNHQPEADRVELIPRFKSLIDSIYPGTKLSISEWNSQADNDITGGLVTAESLGIFGRYGIDAATYWATPGEKAPAGLAYWLYRGYGTYFGDQTAQVKLYNPDPDTWSIFAGSDNNKLTLVIINKKPDQALSFNLSNVPTGSYFMRHFGGAAGVAKWQTTITLTTNKFIVVPSYTAVFLKQQNTVVSSLLIRICVALFTRTVFQPDEYFQSLEPAFYLVFGYGHLTWEWISETPIRSIIYPALNVPVYWFLKASGLAYAGTFGDILLILLPKILHGCFAALTDIWLCELARVTLGNDYVSTAHFLSMSSLFHALALSRSLSNSLETSLSTVAFAYYPWDASSKLSPQVLYNRQRLWMTLIFSALACLIRPTNAVIWVFLYFRLAWSLRRYPRILGKMLSDASLVAFTALGSMFILDSLYYSRPLFTPYNFLKTNLSSVSLFYGSSPWHYYLTQAIPILCTTALPFALHGIITTFRQPKHSSAALGNMLNVILWSISIYSFAGHKEWRFIHPLLPLLHIFAAKSLIDMSLKAQSHVKAKAKAMNARATALIPPLRRSHLTFLLLSLPASIYVILFYCSGPISVLSYLRSLPVNVTLVDGKQQPQSVGFLMPCHSTPGQAYLHRPTWEVWSLGCEPPLQ